MLTVETTSNLRVVSGLALVHTQGIVASRQKQGLQLGINIVVGLGRSYQLTYIPMLLAKQLISDVLNVAGV